MHIYEVGELFKEGITRYQEGCIFDVTDGGAVLNLFYSTPSELEIEAAKSGTVQTKILYKNDIIFMLFKFIGQEWIDCPYTVHLSKNLTQLQEIENNTGYALNINLIDANTGILKVMRLIAIDNRRSKLLKKYIEQQKTTFNKIEYNKNINTIYNTYTSKQLVQFAE